MTRQLNHDIATESALLALVNTSPDPQSAAYVLAEWAISVFSRCLRDAGLTDHANAIAALKITSPESAEIAASAVSEIGMQHPEIIGLPQAACEAAFAADAAGDGCCEAAALAAASLIRELHATDNYHAAR